ncbi:MAG: FkbM family methyltransferase [Bacteroidota bacterium]
MMNWLKKCVWSILNLSYLGALVQLRLKSGMKDDGWFKSFKTKRSVDANGNPIPWCTYSYIRFVEERLKNNFLVFEYGSGGSTVWYSKRVKNVIAVEHNKEWVDFQLKNLPKNVSVIYKNDKQANDYENEIAQHSTLFDVVIVDGVKRNECVYTSINYLSDSGVIVYDNSQLEEYKSSIDFLLSKNFKRIDFWGLTPIIAHNNCTSIFYRENNCLGI